MTDIAALNSLPIGAQVGLIGFGVAFALLIVAHIWVIKVRAVKQTRLELSSLRKTIAQGQGISGSTRAPLAAQIPVVHRVPKSRPQLRGKRYVSALRGQPLPQRRTR